VGGPPSPEELLAYRDGRLDAAERQRIEERIALYPDAARALADLAAFPDLEPAAGTPELSDEEIGDRWQSFRAKLPERPPAPPARATPAIATLPRRGLRRTAFEPRLAAAALAILAVGGIAGFLGGRASRLPPESAINVKIAELAPEGESGARAAPIPLEMPEGSEELVLVLGTRAQKDFPAYEAEIVDATGARIWSREGLQPTPLGTFQVSFRQGALKPGDLHLRLFGREGGARTPVATYELRVAPGAGPR
jgi:anti-sigma factor RsiW